MTGTIDLLINIDEPDSSRKLLANDSLTLTTYDFEQFEKFDLCLHLFSVFAFSLSDFCSG